MKPFVRSIALLFALPALQAQTAKFSYSTTISLQVAADGFDFELRSELSREFQGVDGVQILTASAERTVDVVAVRGDRGVITAAAAILSPMKKAYLDSGILQRSTKLTSMQDADFQKEMLLDKLAVFTDGDLRSLARRVVSWVHSEALMQDRDISYRIFREQHPDPH